MVDRWSRLAIEAHLSHALDYGQFHRNDVKWLVKEKILLDAIEDRLAIEMNKLAHLWHSSAAQLTEWDEKEEKFEYHRKEAAKAFKAIGKYYLPWYKKWDFEDSKTIRALLAAMKEQDKDPEFVKWRAEKKADLRELVDNLATQTKAIEGIYAAREKELKERALAQRRRQQRARLRR